MINLPEHKSVIQFTVFLAGMICKAIQNNYSSLQQANLDLQNLGGTDKQLYKTK